MSYLFTLIQICRITLEISIFVILTLQEDVILKKNSFSSPVARVQECLINYLYILKTVTHLWFLNIFRKTFCCCWWYSRYNFVFYTWLKKWCLIIYKSLFFWKEINYYYQLSIWVFCMIKWSSKKFCRNRKNHDHDIWITVKCKYLEFGMYVHMSYNQHTKPLVWIGLTVFEPDRLKRKLKLILMETQMISCR